MNPKSKSIMKREEIMKSKVETHHFVSSNVNVGTYNPDTHVMQITYNSGVYKYEGIPVEVWEGLKGAESAGKFINEFITGSDRKNPIYKGVRIGD